MRVGDVMTKRVRTLREDDTTSLATALLRFWAFRHLPVLDPEGRVVGMLTPTDLLKCAKAEARQRDLPVSEVMRPAMTVGEDEDLELACHLMRERGIHALPVVSAGSRLVGIVTDVDLLAGLTGEPPELRLLERTPVEAIMTRSPVTVQAETSLGDACRALREGGFRHLPVLDHARRLVGMLSERDVRTSLGVEIEEFSKATLDTLTRPVFEVMTPDPISIPSGTPLADALEILTIERVGALPVVDELERVVGILSYIDLLAWLRDSFGRRARARAS
jgi:CBS domain-containing protein